MTHTDTGSAIIVASPAAVYSALVDESARTRWLPPAGMTGRFDWFDARVGGGYRMTLTYDDPTQSGKTEANTDVVDVRFVELDPPRRLVEEAVFDSPDAIQDRPMTMTWTLEPVADDTRVTITAANVPDSIDSRDHALAFASTLANLNQYVAQQLED